MFEAHREVAQRLGDPDRAVGALLVVAALELLLQQQLARFLAGQRAALVHLADREPEQVRLQVAEPVGVAGGVVLAEQQRVQREQVVDLLRRYLRGVLDVPRVDRVRRSPPISTQAAPGISEARNSKCPARSMMNPPAPWAIARASRMIAAIVLPAPDMPLISSRWLGCAGSNGSRRSSVRPGSA